MANDAWYYAQGGNRIGPVTREQIDRLVQGGELQRGDLVWTVGMSQWAAAETTELFASAPASFARPIVDALDHSTPAIPPTTYAQPTGPASISYYSAGGGIPARAAVALKGHA